MRHFTWKLELVSNILWMIADADLLQFKTNLSIGFFMSKVTFEPFHKYCESSSMITSNVPVSVRA